MVPKHLSLIRFDIILSEFNTMCRCLGHVTKENIFDIPPYTFPSQNSVPLYFSYEKCGFLNLSFVFAPRLVFSCFMVLVLVLVHFRYYSCS